MVITMIIIIGNDAAAAAIYEDDDDGMQRGREVRPGGKRPGMPLRLT